jgi:hypothetical protein
MQWILGAAVALLASAEASAAGKYTTPDNETLKVDSHYMAQLVERASANKGTTSIKIDFADDAQYRFVVNRLLAGGNTPDNSPYLFSRVERMRQKAKTPKREGVTPADASAPKKCGHMVELTKTNNGANADYHANPLVSCFSGADYTYADIYAYRSTEAGLNRTLLASNSGEEYGGGRNFKDVGVDVSIPMNAGYKLTLDSMVMAYDDVGGEFTSYDAEDTVIIYPNFTITHSHPVERLVVPETTVRTCLERGAVTGDNLDCDYASVSELNGKLIPYGANYATPTGIAAVKLPVANKTWEADQNLYWKPTDSTGLPVPYNINKLYAPLAGMVKINDPSCTITGFKETTRAVLVVKQAGGTCMNYTVNTEIPEAGNFRAALLKGLPATDISYSLLGDFGQDCLAYLRDNAGLEWQDVELKFFLYPIVKCTTNQQTRQMFQPVTVALMLDFRNSCLAEGTQILKADGSKAPIESIQVGDKVMANTTGLALTVTTLSRGRETDKMVRLRDDKGHEVLLTTKHPLMTSKGAVLAAEQVKVGDELLASGGKATVTSVERVAYQGQVYNLALGTSAEMAKLSDKDRTLVANGFVVGDSQMQTELEVKMASKPSAGDVLARLPKALHQDYKNDLARKAALAK